MQDTIGQAATESGLRATSVATYGGSSAAVIFGMAANEAAALGGLAVAVVAAIANIALTWWYKHKHYQLARAKRAGDDATGDE